MSLLPIVHNLALLVSLSTLHGLLLHRRFLGTWSYRISTGLFFGAATVLGMLSTLTVAPGVHLDGRSILVSVAAFVGGPVSALLCTAAAAAFRLWLGGAGTAAGLAGLLASALVGLLFHHLRRRQPRLGRPLGLLAFGFAVHVAVLAGMVLCSGDLRGLLFPRFLLPLLAVYALVTLLVCMLFVDQEARVRSEAALRRSENRLHSLFQAVPTGLGSMVGREIRDANGFLCDITGYRREELLGQSARLLYTTEEDFLAVEAESQRQIRETGTSILETRWRRKDGEMRDILLSWAPLDPDTPERGMTAAALDITARKQAERERDHLEEQLRQAQKLEAIGLLASGVAHDLNNLLSPIMGYGEMVLLETPKEDPRRRRVEGILKASRRARDLVKQLMAFGRRQTLEVRPMNLNAALQEYRSLLQRALREDIRITWELEPKLPTVVADRGQVEQVLMNLALNAQDAMPKGGLLSIATGAAELDEAYAAAHPGVAPGHYARLTVADTGEGMDAATRARIFEPFFTTKELGKGSGLGLATVYGIVKQHNGHVNVYSEPGHGTVFRIYLPATEAAPDPEPTPMFVPEIPEDPSATILVAEDDPTVRQMTGEMLHRLGYRVLSAPTPEACLELATAEGPALSLLLSDVVMPGLSGKELSERIRARHPEVRTLFMSGYTANVIAHEGVLEPGVAFIQKPFTMKDLGEKVRTVLEA